ITYTDVLNISGLDPSSVPYIDASQNLVDYVLTNGQVLIGNTGSIPLPGTINPTTNQTTVTNGAGNITIGTVQNIGTTSSPTFSGITVSSLTANQPVHTDASKQLISGLISLTGDVTGVLPITKGGTNSSAARLNRTFIISSTSQIV